MSLKQVSAVTDRPAQHSASCLPCCTQMLMVSLPHWPSI